MLIAFKICGILYFDINPGLITVEVIIM